MKWTQMKGLGLNFTAGISNIMFGMVSNMTHANGRRDFNNKELFNAFRMILKSKSQMKGENKIFNLIKKFNILFDVIDTHFGNDDNATATAKANTKLNRFKEKHGLNIYTFQTKGEYLVQGMSFIALLLHTQVSAKYTRSGKPLSMYDIYLDNGELNADALN